MRQATLLFLIQDKKILLAMKKRGFGMGKWNGVGGKPQPGESIEDAAIRECQEEIGVMPLRLKRSARINFYFPTDKSDWNQQVIVFLCQTWDGEPKESEEMAPKWFSKDTLPFDAMWDDDAIWLPKVLSGQFVEADFYFDDKNKVIKQHLKASNKR
jgi:mutator protein MutT